MKKPVMLIAVLAILIGLLQRQKPTSELPANQSAIPSVKLHSPAKPDELPLTYEIKSAANVSLNAEPNVSREVGFTNLETPAMAVYKAEFIGAERIHQLMKIALLREKYYLEDGAGMTLTAWPK